MRGGSRLEDIWVNPPSPPSLHALPQGYAPAMYTDKKENQIFLIYREIQSGAVAKSYIRKSFLIYEEM
jgi:hypothetical protein